MKTPNLIPIAKHLTLVGWLVSVVGCGQGVEKEINSDSNVVTSSVGATHSVGDTQAIRPVRRDWDEAQWSQYQRDKEEALEHAAKLRKEAMTRANQAAEKRLENASTNMMPLPNYDTGPGRPNPLARNFYQIDKRYPAYLLCNYDVYENHYDETNESEWFKEALLQVRWTGRDRFSSIKWVAVAIFNRADHKGAATFENCFKVGAIFNANDVFDLEGNLSDLVAHATIDRHPLKYDPQQPTPGGQQQWMIVERHAATNKASMPSFSPTSTNRAK